MAGNPRIDELRKKLDKEPGSRLFAQLAEELRKDGDLEEAIQVAREGLQKHPSYPSARMTLGRALFDTGDWSAARMEFEKVLQGAPDNILASRLLGESLENLGDVEAATARYQKTLTLAPGDKQVLARLDALQKGTTAAGSAAPAPAVAPAAAAGAPPPRTVSASPPPAVPPPAGAPPPAPSPPAVAPIRLVEVDTPMELETSHDRAAALAGPPPSPREPSAGPEVAAAPPAPAGPAPIPLVAADEDFELERPYERPAPTPSAAPPVAAPPAPPPPPARADAGEGGMMEFEFDAGSGGTMPFAPPPAQVAAPPPGEPAARPAAELTSPTLAELYFKQGFTEKAVEVYRQLLDREPGNERFRARLGELERESTAPAAAPLERPAHAPDPAARRVALERTIARLEGMLSAIGRGRP